MMISEPSSRPPIRILMLGIGGAGFFAENSSDVVRHLAYLGRCGRGSRIDLLAFAPGQQLEPKRLQVKEHGQTLTVEAVGGSYFAYMKTMRPRAARACEARTYDVIYCQDPFRHGVAGPLACRAVSRFPASSAITGSFLRGGNELDP